MYSANCISQFYHCLLIHETCKMRNFTSYDLHILPNATGHVTDGGKSSFLVLFQIESTLHLGLDHNMG